jgi:hypothetical protein
MVEKLTLERMAKVAAPLHFVDLWLVGGKDRQRTAQLSSAFWTVDYHSQWKATLGTRSKVGTVKERSNRVVSGGIRSFP